MKHLLTLLFLFSLLVSPAAANAAPLPPPPTLTTLQPGGFRTISQALPINLVFVGYEPGSDVRAIDATALRAGLPNSYRTVNRIPKLLGASANLGLEFSYQYNFLFADSTFEDAFFTYLSSIATPKPLTIYQQWYNGQQARSLDVTANHWIDAPSVEKWLAANAGPRLGINTAHYTVFLINWFGRADFKFHVYTKTNEPDPDTGYNFGVELDSRKLIAWGGTTPDDEESGLGSLHRIWFFDLSAGPEGWADNWNLDNASLDFSPGMDYRIPPVWEYGNGRGYRPFNNLNGDLAKVVRYVALDLLFTTSPLYKPAISPPRLPYDLQLDLTVYQGEPGIDGKRFFDLALLTDELSELRPLNTIGVELNEASLSGRIGEVYTCLKTGVSCFGQRSGGIAFFDLSLYHQDHLNQFLEGDGDYEIPGFAFNTNDPFTGGLGFADNNGTDGTQTFIYGFSSTDARANGYGFSTTFIHEAGHHLGLSHPNDGYDAEADLDFAAFDDFRFASYGDQSNSMMGYIDLNWDFSQFDRDNMNRYLTAVYLNQANALLGSIYAKPQAGEASPLLLAADSAAAQALTAYAGMDYANAAALAKSAYDQVLAAAAQIHLPVEPRGWPADYKAHGANPRFVDNVDYQRSKP